MYNRYIPQPDGSYRRSQFPERKPTPPPPPPVQEPIPEPQPCEQPSSGPGCGQCPHRQTGQRPPQRPRQERPPENVGSFLKNLLPGNFNTEDLLIILLLLLMSGECQEERNIPLLTLALYLFL